jgi:hypothetical protein
MGDAARPVQPPGRLLGGGFPRAQAGQGRKLPTAAASWRSGEGSEWSGHGPSLARASEQAGIRCAMAKRTVVRTTEDRKATIVGGRIGTGNIARSAPGRPERRRINSSEELGGGMEVGRRRFGQGCEASLVPGRVQTQGRARRRGLAAHRLGRGCDSPKQTRPLPPRLVTATKGETGSGRIVNREALTACYSDAPGPTRSTREVESEISASRSFCPLDDGVSTRHR